jgi:hypothetical protein
MGECDGLFVDLVLVRWTVRSKLIIAKTDYAATIGHVLGDWPRDLTRPSSRPLGFTFTVIGLRLTHGSFGDGAAFGCAYTLQLLGDVLILIT